MLLILTLPCSFRMFQVKHLYAPTVWQNKKQLGITSSVERLSWLRTGNSSRLSQQVDFLIQPVLQILCVAGRCLNMSCVGHVAMP